jgi:hypothetical protein
MSRVRPIRPVRFPLKGAIPQFGVLGWNPNLMVSLPFFTTDLPYP